MSSGRGNKIEKIKKERNLGKKLIRDVGLISGTVLETLPPDYIATYRAYTALKRFLLANFVNSLSLNYLGLSPKG
jgi:hypothetical protein